MKKLTKTNSHRQQKLASIINEVLIEILKRGKMLDRRLFDCPLTITKIVVTADLKIANCYFFPFNTKLTFNDIMDALNNSKHAIRNFITNKINMKFSPEIRFHYDYGFDNAIKIEKLLKSSSLKDKTN
ncbi:30S ribosome-binding factor RbfA [Rickettsia typhi]|uniref:Ribosome-binding factor A n=2 Tax=Rickettsia typhi TaxID=785 RepID=RBFA_RICTY|nr:30S ribosome-binding factor RbfA [Rickettsia typhi]Q68WU3.1 RecName: Full=Ribosome-binding factor A [Rickettsia typhi str. Wilmington]AAU03899.1 ribosome-binding factor A [Rickettsia typhi str. Wilmington]AFE54280.1 ribosome-binding factor A [Rickettsia typhi str. TH1527]AFE55120.1 ribosome-binding factor A [Rickettsia typhi str. B9991CWPP]